MMLSRNEGFLIFFERCSRLDPLHYRGCFVSIRLPSLS
jgi:hypothetical protein